MADPEEQSESSPPVSPAPDAIDWPRYIPAHQWRLLLPVVLIVLAGAAYYWQRHQGVETGSLETALSDQAEKAARIDAASRRAAYGERAAFASLRRLKTLAATAQKDARKALAGSPAWLSESAVVSALDELDAAWQTLYRSADRLLELETATLTLRADVEAFQSIATGILVTTDEMVDALVAAGESPAQIRTAARQLLLIQRISANVRRVLEGGDGVITAADRLGRDAVLFGEVNIALLNGNPRLNIRRTSAPAARETLVDIGREFRRGTELIEQIMADAVAMVEAREATAEIGTSSARLVSRITSLQGRLARLEAERTPGPFLAETFGLLALFSLLVAMVHIASTTRSARRSAGARMAEEARRAIERSERESRLEERERATAEAVSGLIDELDRLARGEEPAEPRLRETVRDTAVAPIAVVVSGLRQRLQALTRSARKLAKTGREFDRTARQARSVADELNREFERSVTATKRMAAHVEPVGEHGRKAARIGAEANALVSRAHPLLAAAASQSGATCTSARAMAARVRQLNESTRNIEEVGRLVDEISEQCRMLSLNVSIRASLADRSGGDAGMASFGEEIKKLADNSRRAMRRIKSVNEDVRSHAGQAADSVKQVLWSAEKAVAQSADAGKEISRAMVLSQRLETLNRQLAEALQEHTEMMIHVVKSTTAVHGVAARVRGEFRDVASNASRLSELAGLLETTVSGFDRTWDSEAGVVELKDVRADDPAMAPRGALGDAPREATAKD